MLRKVFTDYLNLLCVNSLSNKGQASNLWRYYCYCYYYYYWIHLFSGDHPFGKIVIFHLLFSLQNHFEHLLTSMRWGLSCLLHPLTRRNIHPKHLHSGNQTNTCEQIPACRRVVCAKQTLTGRIWFVCSWSYHDSMRGRWLKMNKSENYSSCI